MLIDVEDEDVVGIETVNPLINYKHDNVENLIISKSEVIIVVKKVYLYVKGENDTTFKISDPTFPGIII